MVLLGKLKVHTVVISLLFNSYWKVYCNLLYQLKRVLAKNLIKVWEETRLGYVIFSNVVRNSPRYSTSKVLSTVGNSEEAGFTLWGTVQPDSTQGATVQNQIPRCG